MMILCSAISFDSGLPAWMFHCQTPPPDYAFHPEVRGLTWVDMVFPLFIFALGAALPFSLKSRKKGEAVLFLVRRFVVLVAFSLALGHADALRSTACPPVLGGFLRLGIWLLMFCALVRTERWKWLNPLGWALLAGAFVALHFCYDLPFKWAQNDCIIMLLAWAVLMGGLICLFTLEKPRLRALALLIVVAARLLGFEFTQYLIIVLPATIASDAIRGAIPWAGPRDGKAPLAGGVVALAAALVQLWGLFTRQVRADLAITCALLCLFLLLVYKHKSAASHIGLMGFLLLLAGIVCDFHDGGLAKDYCNLSYLLVTGGMSCLLLHFLMCIEQRHPLSRNLVLCGQNPMIAYTIAWYVVCPLLALCGVTGWFDPLCAGHPWLGLLRGVVITLLAVAATCAFTRRRIFWKS